MNTALKKIALKRLNILTTCNIETRERTLSPLAYKAQLLSLGYVLTNGESLGEIPYNDRFFFKIVFKVLKEKRGGDVDYVPLFTNFPDDVPNEDEYFMKRVIGFLGGALASYSEETTELKEDSKDYLESMTHALFDTSEFGANPITQKQEEAIYEEARKKMRARESVSMKSYTFTELTVMDEDTAFAELIDWTCKTLTSPVSIPKYLEEDILYILENEFEEIFGKLQLGNIKSREIKALLLKTLFRRGLENKEEGVLFHALAPSPVDILRMCALLTNTDVSLASKIRFPKFRRVERKFLVEVLASSHPKSLEEAFYKYSGLFLALFKSIHIGDYLIKMGDDGIYLEQAVRKLRNNVHSLYRVEQEVEESIKEGNLQNLLSLLSRRPGLFIRRLTELMKKFPKNYGDIEEAFMSVIGKISTSQLFVAMKHLQGMEAMTKQSYVLKNGHLYTKDTPYKEVPNGIQMMLAISDELQGRYNEKDEGLEELKEADYIVFDRTALDRFIFPFSPRTQSEGLFSLEKGSKIDVSEKMEDNGILRMFIYWKDAANKTTDLDLSVGIFDEDYTLIDNCSFHHLTAGDGSIQHSGDLQSGTFGAAEFIDIDLETVRQKIPKARYFVITANSYSGGYIGDCEKVYAGYSFRDKGDSDKSVFDIKNVDMKFDVSVQARFFLSHTLDIEKKEIIIADTLLSAPAHADISLRARTVADIALYVEEREFVRPTIAEVLDYVLLPYKEKLKTEEEVEEILKRYKKKEEGQGMDTFPAGLDDLYQKEEDDKEEKTELHILRIGGTPNDDINPYNISKYVGSFLA